jgi:photosystem II stability/assembly factor-like uncharacterized protein
VSAIRSDAGPSSSSGISISVRRRWLPPALLAFYLLAVAGLGFYTEYARPLPDPRRPVTGMSWWFTPRERNAFMRMPVITGVLRGMDVSRNGQVIVIVSSEDAIFSSTDAGRSWIRGGLGSVTAAPSARPPSGAFNLNLPLGLRSVAKAQDLSFDVEEEPSSNKREKEPRSLAAPSADKKPKRPNDVTDTAKPPEVSVPQESITPQPSQQKRGLSDVSIVDERTYVAVGEQGLIVRTVDAGQTWTEIRSSPSMTMNAVACHGSTCLAVGELTAVARSTDAGLTWNMELAAGPSSDSARHLHAIARVSGDSWIAVGERGYILHLDGDGRSSRAEQLGGPSFFDVAFDASGQNGMAVGAELYVTRNGGASWQRASSPAQRLRRVVFNEAGYALAVGNHDVHVYETRDLGENWSARALGSATIGRTGRGVLRSGGPPVTISDGAEQLAIDAQGRALFLRGDNSLFVQAEPEWKQLTFGAADFTGLAMHTATRGSIVGAEGTILWTDDGGETWVPVDSHVIDDLRAISTGDAEHAIAIGSPDVVLRTSDAGAHWTATTVSDAAPLSDVRFADARHVFLLGSSLFESNDGGLSWARNDQRRHSDLGFADSATGVSHQSGSLLGTHDGGASWRPLGNGRAVWLDQKGRTTYALFDLQASERAEYGAVELEASAESVLQAAKSSAFADDEIGLAIPISGDKLLRTSDHGTHWASIASPTRAPLIAARFASDKRVVALAQGRVIVSDDAGQSFRAVRYQRSPAPWLWLAALLLVATVLLYARQTINAPDLAQPQASITDAAASDRPIEWWDPDHAGLRDIAKGLSRFLRNRKTEPPLTVAITGEWGTGKSSLMNLLRHDLERYGYRPVWFNAWHHQSGENLLASLLANIHAQGVPSLLSLAGLDFRVSLTAIRARRLWLQVTLTLVVFAVVVFSYPILKENWVTFWSSLTAKEDGAVSGIKAASGLLGIALSVITPFLSAARVVSAFGLQPGKLIAAVATTNADESTRQQAGARYRFAREFEDFTRALQPRPLVIFIDDLDRCRAPNVVEVLEAINFLVSSGRCIVVIGMARRWVETCVGLAFQELAEAHTDDTEASGGSERQLFARQYLEKLVNIEVRVPPLSAAAAAAILQSVRPSAPDHDARYALGTFLLRGLRWVGLLAGLLAIAALGYGIAQLLRDLGPAHPPTQALVRHASTPPRAAQAIVATRPDTTEPPPETTAQPSLLDPPNAPAPAGIYWGTGLALALVALAILVALALFSRRRAQTEDSPAFRSALGIMHPFILLGGSSPRSLKRFVNHVRYVAMRSRTGDDEPSPSERLAHSVRSFFGRSSLYTPSAASTQVPLPEELLVALAALHRCGEHWLEALFISEHRQDLRLFLHHELSQRFRDEPSMHALTDELWVALGSLNQKFGAELMTNAEHSRRYALHFLNLVANEARPTTANRPPTHEPTPHTTPEASASEG